jgi:hypothetical protein
MTWSFLENRGCSCDINRTRLKKNENIAIAAKPTWSCNTIFDYTSRCEIKKRPPKKLYIAIGVANSAATTAILALTLCNGSNKAHGKGIKLAETGRYLARHRTLT